MKVGIIGYGNFGEFLAQHLAFGFHVMVTDLVKSRKRVVRHCVWGSLKQVTKRPVVILAVPLQSLESVLKQIAPLLKPGTLVIDVCSVKVKPIELMEKNLPECIEILGTHPLFGPQSAKDGLRGKKIVLCPVRISVERMLKIHALLDHCGVETFVGVAEVHDQEMAMVQGLTHFVARALRGCDIRKSQMATLAFNRLYEVVELLGWDSWDLFETIELGNPFAADIRAKFMEHLQAIEGNLIHKTTEDK